MYTKKNDISVSDVMLNTNSFPIVNENELLKPTIEQMNKHKLGIACIADKKKKLLAVITDGDIRRIILSAQKPLPSLFVEDVIDYSSKDFIIVNPSLALDKAIDIMGEKKIWDLPVVSSIGEIIGLLHLHPAIKAVMNS